MFDITGCTPETYRANESAYSEILKDYKNWQEIPLLNYTPLHELEDLSLVRFRGMIQDMFNPEIYLEKYEVQQQTSTESCSSRIQDGKYRDCLVLKANETVNYDSTSNAYGDRRTIFVISIPGINKWATDIESNETIQRRKSKVEQGDFAELSPNHGQKRQINEKEENNVQNDAANTSQPPDSNSTHKKLRTETAINNSKNSNCLLSPDYLLNSPIAERPSKACMIKVYSDFDDFTLNSMIEVVGFLSVDPSLDGSTSSVDDLADNFMDMCEVQATNPPPSLIPRLHAIAIKKLEHVNPLLDPTIDDNVFENLNPEVIRNDLKIVLTQCLFGDDVAADYLISHLISKVHVRTDYRTLGQITLNISNIPSAVLSEYTQRFYEIIESLLPASHYFPMTLENMNSVQFVPKKNYETNRLTSGLLQLAPHTHLILDETKLQAGKLESNGILGVQSLSHLIKTQKFKCDFEFYDINFNTSIPVLILSEGKSMLPSDFHIPLHVPNSENIQLILETLKAAKFYLQSKLSDFRKYLTISKVRYFNMNSIDNQMIEDDFVKIRRTNNQFGADELHSLLVLSRLIGISKGKQVLDQQSWNSAKEIEATRKSRIERVANEL